MGGRLGAVSSRQARGALPVGHPGRCAPSCPDSGKFGVLSVFGLRGSLTSFTAALLASLARACLLLDRPRPRVGCWERLHKSFFDPLTSHLCLQIPVQAIGIDRFDCSIWFLPSYHRDPKVHGETPATLCCGYTVDICLMFMIASLRCSCAIDFHPLGWGKIQSPFKAEPGSPKGTHPLQVSLQFLVWTGGLEVR